MAEASLPLTQCAREVTHDTTRLCWIDVTILGLLYHSDSVKGFSWIFFMHFLSSDGESPRLVKNAEVKLVMKPKHPTSIGNKLVIQTFLTLCAHRSSYFSSYADVSSRNFHLCLYEIFVAHHMIFLVSFFLNC